VYRRRRVVKDRSGNAQGSVISPLLSNIYLHYVLDTWGKPLAQESSTGEVIIVRYADDFVMGFQYRHEAGRFLVELKERFAEYGLEIHSEKTRLIEFGRFAEASVPNVGKENLKHFDFLDSRNICSRTRKRNRFIIRRKTIAKRLRAKIKEVREEIMRKRHERFPHKGPGFVRSCRVISTTLQCRQTIEPPIRFVPRSARDGCEPLRRRSQKSLNLTWARIERLIATWIPTADVQHPYPMRGYALNNPR